MSGAGLLSGYDVSACKTCGFCYADHLPSRDEFDAYYEQQSKYEHDYRSLALSEFDLRNRPFAAGIISDWIPDRDARILDIGCAAGGLLAELKRRGYNNLLGLDPSPACARAAKEMHGIEVMTAPLSKIPRKIGSFDLVIFGSVLEHLPDLNETADLVRNLLNPGGCVHIEVPDMSRCSLMEDAPYQEFSLEHINYFSPVSLRNLWEKHGFHPAGMRQTEIVQTPGLTLYEIKAMFRLGAGESAARFEPDNVTKPELERYIQRSRTKEERISRIIDALVEERKPLIVWGVGTHTQGLMAGTRLGETDIRAFVDSNTRYAGKNINRIPVVSTDSLRELPHDILVSSHQFQGEIVDQIRNRLKLGNGIITLYQTAPLPLPEIG